MMPMTFSVADGIRVVDGRCRLRRRRWHSDHGGPLLGRQRIAGRDAHHAAKMVCRGSQVSPIEEEHQQGAAGGGDVSTNLGGGLHPVLVPDDEGIVRLAGPGLVLVGRQADAVGLLVEGDGRDEVAGGHHEAGEDEGGRVRSRAMPFLLQEYRYVKRA